MHASDRKERTLILMLAYHGPALGLAGRESTCNVEDLGSILGWKDLLEKGTHTSVLAWRIPWTI